VNALSRNAFLGLPRPMKTTGIGWSLARCSAA